MAHPVPYPSAPSVTNTIFRLALVHSLTLGLTLAFTRLITVVIGICA